MALVCLGQAIAVGNPRLGVYASPSPSPVRDSSYALAEVPGEWERQGEREREALCQVV